NARSPLTMTVAGFTGHAASSRTQAARLSAMLTLLCFSVASAAMCVSEKKANVFLSRDLPNNPAWLFGGTSSTSPMPTPASAARFRNSRRVSCGSVTGINSQQKSRERGGHVGGEQATAHRTETDLGHFAAAFGRERADAADLDGDAREVREPAQRVGGNREAARVERELFRIGREVEVADEFVEHDALAEGLPDAQAVLRRHAHEPGERRVDPAEKRLQRGR